MFGQYQRFIRVFANVLTALNTDTSKSDRIKQREKCKALFVVSRLKLTVPPVSVLLNFHGAFTVRLDAILVAVGAVLSEKQKQVDGKAPPP